MPPPPEGMPPPPAFFFGTSATMASVVISRPATDAAFWIAARSNISTQLMLKTIIEIISTMSDDPEKYRTRLKAKLFELADTTLAAMTPTREDKVRALVRETINTVLTNSRPN
jgi:hypothetical protein